ncbi:hypothetical protein CON25_32490, partial [Bacillus thuringiensis]
YRSDCFLNHSNILKCKFKIPTLKVVPPHRYQAKVLKYPLNENFFSLQAVTLRSQLIFFVLGRLFFLS